MVIKCYIVFLCFSMKSMVAWSQRSHQGSASMGALPFSISKKMIKISKNATGYACSSIIFANFAN